MATNDIHVTVSDNNVSAPLTVSGGTSPRSVSTDNGSPYYVGARAYVTQTENGATVTVIDKEGTTTATVLNGVDGQDGITPSFSIGTVETLEPSSPATATITGTDENPVLNLGIPKGESAPMYFATTAEWASRASLISEAGSIYVYTDHKQVGDVNIAGFKVGDGLAYVVDLPFTDALMDLHINNTDIHVTTEEKAFWNSKNRGFVNGENLILTDL